MEDSTGKCKKLHSHECPFCLPICDSILQPLISIMKFLGFIAHGGACRPMPEDSYSGDSDPPSTAVHPPPHESEEESEYYRRHVPPRPPWSSGGGGQTD